MEVDLSSFCEVTMDDNPTDNDGVLDDLTEDDIVLLDAEYEEQPAAPSPSPGSKRPPPYTSNGGSPAVKKRKSLPELVSVHSVRPAHSPHSPATAAKQSKPVTLQQAVRLKQLAVSAKQSSSPARTSAAPVRLKQSITWKYRQLAENQYTADIRKVDLLRNYEPEPCLCGRAEEGRTACGSGCVNRSTYSECDSGVCKNGPQCTNQPIQRRQYAPGLERFMTAKKGWGVRARQSIEKNSFILEYTGEICSKEEFERRMGGRYKGDNHHYCLALDSKLMIDAQRAGSECRFVNHSCAPNCEMEKWTVGGLSRMALFALRDIQPGEEICYDYNFSLFNTSQGQECKCGAPDCRGVIGGKGKDYLITLDGDPEPTEPRPAGKPAKPQINNARTAEDELWFTRNSTVEDREWFEKNAPKPGQLEARVIKCTVCNEHLDFKVQSQCCIHPDLGVLLCRKCRGQYGKGGWDKDKDGNDEFCRWCSEGGQIFLCDFCPHAFCSKCMRCNLGRKYLKKIEEDEKWKCLICDPSFLKEHRALYWAIYKYHKDKNSKSNSTNNVSSAALSKSSIIVSQAGKVKVAGNSGKVFQPVNGFSHGVSGQPSQGTIRKAYTKLQRNSEVKVTVSPVKNSSIKQSPVNNKPNVVAKPTVKTQNNVTNTSQKMEVVLKDVEDCIQQFASMVGEVKKMWRLSGKNEKDASVVLSKLSKTLVLAKQNIDEVDKKVQESEERVVPCTKIKNEVKDSSKKVEVTYESDTAGGGRLAEETGGRSSSTNGSEEGIHDVSVDEFDVESEKNGIINEEENPFKKEDVKLESSACNGDPVDKIEKPLSDENTNLSETVKKDSGGLTSADRNSNEADASSGKDEPQDEVKKTENWWRAKENQEKDTRSETAATEIHETSSSSPRASR